MNNECLLSRACFGGHVTWVGRLGRARDYCMLTYRTAVSIRITAPKNNNYISPWRLQSDGCHYSLSATKKIIQVRHWHYYLKEKKLSNVQVALSIAWRCNSNVYGIAFQSRLGYVTSYAHHILTDAARLSWYGVLRRVWQEFYFISCPDELLCSEEEVLHFLMQLDTTKATGPDNIPARMLKETARAITPSLTKLFNISMQQCSFPTFWKLANVVPIPKGSSLRSTPTGYRPISLLPIVSKVFEKHIYSLVSSHLHEHCPISDKQWGFQAGKSTTNNNCASLVELS